MTRLNEDGYIDEDGDKENLIDGHEHPKLERRSAVLLLLLCHAQATPPGF